MKEMDYFKYIGVGMEINELSRILRQNGIAGAGGAGFPAYAKLSENTEIIILNCAECEPLLKLHRQLLNLCVDEIIKALDLIAKTLNVKDTVIGIKKEYKETIDTVKRLLNRYPNMRIKELNNAYPMGDEIVLIYEATGRVIRPGGIPIEEGVTVFNVETVFNIYKAVFENKPVTEKYITIAGEVENPTTIKMPIGATFEEAVSHAGRITVDNPIYYAGGPMMGNITSKDYIITKTTNGIIIFPSEHPMILRKKRKSSIDLRRAASACCQCQTCTDICPRHGLGHPIEPHKFMRLAANRDFKDINTFINTLFCSSCGLCEVYSCPQGLSPRALISDYKTGLRKEGVKPPKDAVLSPIKESREYHRVPEERLKARLNIHMYDKEAPIMNTSIDACIVKILLSQHIGKPAEPIVGIGDIVSKGQMIGNAADGLSLPIHASINGRVDDITKTYILIRKL